MWQRIQEFAASSDTTRGLSASNHGVLVAACVLNLGLYLLGVHAVRADETVARLYIAPVQDQSARWVNDFSPIGEADWSYEYAAHLLDRTGFGGTPEAIRRFAGMTPAEAVDRIVDYRLVDTVELSGASVGRSSFETKQRNEGTYADRLALRDLIQAREWEGIASDWGRRMLTSPTPFAENMTLFWHRHFASVQPGQGDPRYAVQFTETLRTHATGNVRDILAAVLSHVDRLKPPQDVAGPYRRADRYDIHAVVAQFALGEGVGGDFDGIESIVGHDACAPFISGQIYRYFVCHDASPSTRGELARVLRQSDYELRPLLKAIFLSKDFYSPRSKATTVQGPVHYYVSARRKLAVHDFATTSEIPSATSYEWSVPRVSMVEDGRAGTPWQAASSGRDIGNTWRQLLFPAPSLTAP